MRISETIRQAQRNENRVFEIHLDLAATTNTITVEVITTAQAVARLIDLSNADASRPQSLRATLAAAIASIDRSNPVSAVNQLLAFQNQVRAQVAPVDADLAETFIKAAQQVIDILSAGNTNPGGHPRAKITSLARQFDGRVRMQIAADSSGTYFVEASTDLADWEMIGVAAVQPDGSLGFEDRQAACRPQRFYRAVVLP